MKSNQRRNDANRKVLYFISAKGLTQPENSSNYFRLSSTSFNPSPFRRNSSFSDRRREEHPNFDARLSVFECKAYNKFQTARQKLVIPQPSTWFNRYLQNQILPIFTRIGYDERITRTLFCLAAKEWELMGPVSANGGWCHTDLIRAVEEIGAGIEAKTKKRRDTRQWWRTASCQDRLEATKDHGDPQYLKDAIDDITTSWIVLPRVFQFLKKEDSRYLPAYLRYFQKSTNPDCQKIFARIIIEYTANFTFKFARKNYPAEPLLETLISGYKAMFWKNLRTPPNGLEEIRIFENFLNWTKNLKKIEPFGAGGQKKSIARMTAMLSSVFPAKSSEIDIAGREVDDRFLVGLRHGSYGFGFLLKYFLNETYPDKDAISLNRTKRSDLEALHSLLQTIKKRYHCESPSAQRFILDFLYRLQSMVALNHIRYLPSENGCRQLLSFLGLRIANMIEQLAIKKDYCPHLQLIVFSNFQR